MISGTKRGTDTKVWIWQSRGSSNPLDKLSQPANGLFDMQGGIGEELSKSLTASKLT
jgi:hypothetical protein